MVKTIVVIRVWENRLARGRVRFGHASIQTFIDEKECMYATFWPAEHIKLFKAVVGEKRRLSLDEDRWRMGGFRYRTPAGDVVNGEKAEGYFKQGIVCTPCNHSNPDHVFTLKQLSADAVKAMNDEYSRFLESDCNWSTVVGGIAG